MTVSKSAYLRFVLCCVLFASLLLTSDVSAKTHSTGSYHSRSTSHHSHQSSHGSSGTHQSYPSHSGGLSGNSVSTHHRSPSKHSTYPGGHNSGSTGHSYPSAPLHSLSGGSSGGSHGYPSSPSLSGSGNRPSSAPYPAHNNGKTSTSGGHSYPPTNTLSGSGSRPGSSSNSTYNNGKVSTSTGHSYPPTNTLSGSGGRSDSGYSSNTGYGNAGTHYSGGSSHRNKVIHESPGPQVHYVNHKNSQTVIHHYHHYDYSPPTVIHFRSSYHSSPINYPVYTGIPPSYVYEYQSSGNRYSSLLAGLALYNLGRISATSRSQDYHKHYIPQSDEYCKFGVLYKTGNFDEMAIDCRAITYFIYETQPQAQTHVTKNIFNQTTVTTQYMLPNGTLMTPANAQAPISVSNMPVGTNMQANFNTANALMPNSQQIFDSAGTNIQSQQNAMNSLVPNAQQEINNARVSMQAEMNAANALMPTMQQEVNNVRANTQQDINIARANIQAEMNAANALAPNTQQLLNSVGQSMPNTQQINTVTTTTQTVSVTDRRLSGNPVEVNPDMECYVTRTTRYSNLRKPVPCGLLQEYAASSLRRTGAGVMVKSSLAMVVLALAVLFY